MKSLSMLFPTGLRFKSRCRTLFRFGLVEQLFIYSALDKGGVRYIGITGAVNKANPWQVYDLVRTIRSIGCDIGMFLCNENGCALANAYCALEAGATHTNTSVLGIGEWVGITALRGLMAGNFTAKKLRDLEEIVAKANMVEIPFNNFVAEPSLSR